MLSVAYIESILIVDMNLQEVQIPYNEDKIDLMVKAERLSYEFYYKSPKETEYQKIGSMATDALTRHRIFDSFCTGTMVGIYALGEWNRPCLQPAYFNAASWSGLRGGPSKWTPSGVDQQTSDTSRAVLEFKFD